MAVERCCTGAAVGLAQAFPLYLKWSQMGGILHRFIPVLAKLVGAEIVEIKVKHHPRTRGLCEEIDLEVALKL